MINQKISGFEVNGMKTKRVKGDRYRPVVTILKTKKGVPTVIQVSGQTYVLRHVDTKR